eukprot:gene19480-21404_t
MAAPVRTSTSRVPLVRSNISVLAALVGVIELLGALACLICTLMFGNITNTAMNKGNLYSKYYDSGSPTRRYGQNGGTYWWAGFPFLLPGMIGIAAYGTRRISVMVVFLIFNVISFFSGIALAIFVGLFYNLWKVPMNAYNTKNCLFEYHEPTFTQFCQCNIVDTNDVKLMDADRMWIFVQGCDEVETINHLLLAIISLAIVTGLIALICSIIAIYAIKTPERPVKKCPQNRFQPLARPQDPVQPKQQQQQQAAPQPRSDYPVKEPSERIPLQQVAQPNAGPKQSYNYDDEPQRKPYAYDTQPPRSYKEQYSSDYPPPYPENDDIKKPLTDDDDEDDIDDGWL